VIASLLPKDLVLNVRPLDQLSENLFAQERLPELHPASKALRDRL
jgi:hypothetical protein